VTGLELGMDSLDFAPAVDGGREGSAAVAVGRSREEGEGTVCTILDPDKEAICKMLDPAIRIT